MTSETVQVKRPQIPGLPLFRVMTWMRCLVDLVFQLLKLLLLSVTKDRHRKINQNVIDSEVKSFFLKWQNVR